MAVRYSKCERKQIRGITCLHFFRIVSTYVPMLHIHRYRCCIMQTCCTAAPALSCYSCSCPRVQVITACVIAYSYKYRPRHCPQRQINTLRLDAPLLGTWYLIAVQLLHNRNNPLVSCFAPIQAQVLVHGYRAVHTVLYSVHSTRNRYSPQRTIYGPQPTTHGPQQPAGHTCSNAVMP